MGNRDIHEFVVAVHQETDLAWLVSETGDEDAAVWVPKSQVQLFKTKQADRFRLEMPEWLCIERGFL